MEAMLQFDSWSEVYGSFRGRELSNECETEGLYAKENNPPSTPWLSPLTLKGACVASTKVLTVKILFDFHSYTVACSKEQLG